MFHQNNTIRIPSLRIGCIRIGASLAFIDIDDKAGDILFFFQIHTGHRLIQKQNFGFQCQCPS